MNKITTIITIAAVLLAGACNKAEDISVNTGEKVTVTYRVALDDAAALTKDAGAATDGTAEYGKGAEIDMVRCLVYTVEDEGYTLFTSEYVDYISGAPIEFSPEFFRNQQYKIVFIAYDTDAYVVSEKAVMTYKMVPETGSANMVYPVLAPEKYDAFTYAGDVSFSGADANVTLVRPFSLWKIYTADEDITSSTNLGATLESASVTATVNTSYDVLNGAFASPVEMTFAREFPADDSQTFKDAENNDVRYTLISAQYIMPSGNVSADLKIFADQNNCVSELSIPNVPTQANSKVNIYGRLATSEKTFSITLDFGIQDNPSQPEINR